MWWRRALDRVRRGLLLLRIAGVGRRVTRARTQEDRDAAQRALVNALAGARGLPMKAGQILASLSGEEVFRPLVEGVEPRSLAELGPRLQELRDGPLQDVLAGLEESSAAASLGQVHRSCLADGTPVAVKIRDPGIEHAVRAELGILGMLPAAGPAKRYGMDTESYRAMLLENLERELDYRSEAARQERFRSAMMKVEGLVVPEVFPELCRAEILVMTWQEGVRLREVAGWPLRDRLLVARTLLTTFFTSLFVVGEVHGDPNPGNYFFQRGAEGPQVILLDFGCTVEVPAARRHALLGLIFGLRKGRPVDLLACLAAAGFEPARLVHIADEMPALCRILFEPFLLEKSFRPKEWRLGARLEALLAERRWWFRTSGPAEGLLLVRAFQGVLEQLSELDVALPWWPLLERALPPAVARRAEEYTPPALLGDLASYASGPRPLARTLEVRILDGEAEARRLSMPAEALLELPELLPAQAQILLEEAEIEVESVVRKIARDGFPPQEVFRVEEGGRTYHAWLE